MTTNITSIKVPNSTSQLNQPTMSETVNQLPYALLEKPCLSWTLEGQPEFPSIGFPVVESRIGPGVLEVFH